MAERRDLWHAFWARPNDDRVKTIGVAVLIAAASALFVSTASVVLQPLQEAHLARERQASMDAMLDTLPGLRDLMLEAGVDALETRIVDLQEDDFAAGVDPAEVDPLAAAEDPAQSVALPPEADVAGLGRRANLVPVYLLEREGALQLIVLPVHGRGYASTIRAYLALEPDLVTVAALTVVEQGETPGLGARIAEPAWQALWPGKEVANEDGEIVVSVVRGEATGPHEVDGITGATRTGNGVTNMLRFWLGEWGYGPFLDAPRAGGPLMSLLRHVTDPLIDENPVTLQILGICSALAVTTSLVTALTMCIALTAVLCASAVVISLIRRHIPPAIRLIVQITIIASLVIVVDEILQAYAWGISKRLSIFVGLIVTNCLVLGRAEGFAIHNPPLPTFLDALGNGLGYSLVLLIVGTVREFLGAGTLFGRAVVATQAEGGWFQPLGLMQLAPSAFFIIGLLVWAIRTRWNRQAEAPESRVAPPAQERAR